MHVSNAALEELQRIIQDSQVVHDDDKKWPAPERSGKQELEIVMGKDHISFATAKIGTCL